MHSSPPEKRAGSEPPKGSGWALLDLSYLRRPSSSLVGLGYAIVVLVGIPIVIAGLWILGQFLVQTFTTAPKDFEDTGRRLIAIGVITAAPFAIWRIIISHWQARAAQAQAAAVARQADVAREEHYTTLFTTAVGQLGAVREVSDSGGTHTEPNTEARLGAIYALERIAQDSERDHWPIMETLCAYVRKNAGPTVDIARDVRDGLAGRAHTGSYYESLRAAREAARPFVDVQAALTVIGRRSLERRQHETYLRDAAVSTASFTLDLTRTNLAGVVLDGLNFNHARFDGSSLRFSTLNKTSVEEASFSDVQAEGAELSGTLMTDASIGGHWEGATFSRAELVNVNTVFASFDGARFEHVDLTGADFGYAELSSVVFFASDLTGTNLKGARLYGVSFLGTKLSQTDVYRAEMVAAYLIAANCAGMVGLTQESIDQSFGDGRTSLPDGLTRPASWLAIDASPTERGVYRESWKEQVREVLTVLAETRDEQADEPF